MMTEVEAKFLIDDASVISRLIDSLRSEGLDVEPLPAVDLVDRYLDTPDWKLLQAGWSHRWRETSDKRNLTLKSLALGEGAVQVRQDVVQQVAEFPVNGHRFPKGRVARRLKGIDRKMLCELFSIRNHRQLFVIRTARDAIIEMAVDHAEIKATASPGRRSSGRLEFDELALELKDGEAASLRELAERLQGQFGFLPARLSKFERGLQTVTLAPPVKRLTPQVRSLENAEFVRDLRARRLGLNTPAVKLAYRHLLDQFEEMLAEEPRAWEGLDPEGVHQMRVATRRIRAAFRLFKRVLPRTESKEFNRQFQWIASVLGRVRDLDVQDGDLHGCLAKIAEEDAACLRMYQERATEHWRDARQDLLKCLSGGPYEQLKIKFSEFLQRGPAEEALRTVGKISVGDAATQFVGKQYRKVLRRGRAITPVSPPDALHALRIACKQLRYLFEFFQPVYGKSLKPHIQRLKKLQDVLGKFHDACLATQRLRGFAAGVPMRESSRQELMTLGQLIYVWQANAARQRQAFDRVWNRFDRKGRRKEILAVLRGN